MGAASTADTAPGCLRFRRQPRPTGPPRRPRFSSISADHIAQKPEQKLLQDRLHWLDEHAKLTLALKKATSPESSPEHQTDHLKAELKQLQAMMAQATKNPESLLPPSFLKNQARRLPSSPPR